MGRCVLWAGASYGPVCLMGRCVLWADVSYGPLRLMGRGIRYVWWRGAKNIFVSTGAFLLNEHDSSYLTSAKKGVLSVPTSGRKSTNMQLRDFHKLLAKIQPQLSCLETA
jgi:hypothetical protein